MLMDGLTTLFSFPHSPAMIAFIMSNAFVPFLYLNFPVRMQKALKIICLHAGILIGEVLLSALLFPVVARQIISPIAQMLVSVLCTAITISLSSLYCCGKNRSWQILFKGIIFMCTAQPLYFVCNTVVSRYIFDYTRTGFRFTDTVTLILYPLLIACMVLFLRKFGIDPSVMVIPGTYVWAEAVFSLSGLALTFFSYKIAIRDENYYSLIVFIVILSLACDYSVYYYLWALFRSYRHNLEMAQFSLRAANDYRAMETGGQLYENMRVLRHELKNHLTLMEWMVQEKEYDRLDAYIKELSTNVYPVLNTVVCPHPIIRMILNSAASMMETAKIRFTSFVSVPEMLTISDTDLCTVLYNLITNAYEAAVLSDQPSVSLTVKMEGDILLIHIQNTFRESTLKNNPDLATTKADRENHGLGIRAIRSVVRKYNGEISFQEENGMFIAKAMLVQPKEV